MKNFWLLLVALVSGLGAAEPVRMEKPTHSVRYEAPDGKVYYTDKVKKDYNTFTRLFVWDPGTRTGQEVLEEGKSIDLQTVRSPEHLGKIYESSKLIFLSGNIFRTLDLQSGKIEQLPNFRDKPLLVEYLPETAGMTTQSAVIPPEGSSVTVLTATQTSAFKRHTLAGAKLDVFEFLHEGDSSTPNSTKSKSKSVNFLRGDGTVASESFPHSSQIQVSDDFEGGMALITIRQPGDKIAYRVAGPASRSLPRLLSRKDGSAIFVTKDASLEIRADQSQFLELATRIVHFQPTNHPQYFAVATSSNEIYLLNKDEGKAWRLAKASDLITESNTIDSVLPGLLTKFSVKDYDGVLEVDLASKATAFVAKARNLVTRATAVKHPRLVITTNSQNDAAYVFDKKLEKFIDGHLLPPPATTLMTITDFAKDRFIVDDASSATEAYLVDAGAGTIREVPSDSRLKGYLGIGTSMDDKLFAHVNFNDARAVCQIDTKTGRMTFVCDSCKTPVVYSDPTYYYNTSKVTEAQYRAKALPQAQVTDALAGYLRAQGAELIGQSRLDELLQGPWKDRIELVSYRLNKAEKVVHLLIHFKDSSRASVEFSLEEAEVRRYHSTLRDEESSERGTMSVKSFISVYGQRALYPAKCGELDSDMTTFFADQQAHKAASH
jgi:hypothetical protein